MVSEKTSHPHLERVDNNERGHEELTTIAHEQGERLREYNEQKGETERDQDTKESALAQARETANEIAESSKDMTHTSPSPAERRRGVISKKEREKSFKTHMADAERDMTTSERTFSKFIHLKSIEKASDFASSTVARPNALLSGSIAAFVTITILYFAAKHYGFQLSGFETIAAFVGGWLLGILYDYLSLLFRGRRRQ